MREVEEIKGREVADRDESGGTESWGEGKGTTERGVPGENSQEDGTAAHTGENGAIGDAGTRVGIVDKSGYVGDEEGRKATVGRKMACILRLAVVVLSQPRDIVSD